MRPKRNFVRKFPILPLAMIIGLVFIVSSLMQSKIIDEDCVLSGEVPEGNACIVYLFHSGWAVKTRNHLLIFDYWEQTAPAQGKTLQNGTIDPKEIADQKVIVFISHAHSDHYDPVILSWKEKIPNLTYVWGWQEKAGAEDLYFDSQRKGIDVKDVRVFNIHHRFDGIPESAFLVSVDGLWIFHAGDHGHSLGEKNPIFKNNIDYLASLTDRVDILFTPTWGGELYAIEKLSPGIVFPMHDGGFENQYEKFKQKVKNLGINIQVGAAQKPGDYFFIKKK